ncbi:hypothetical protein HHI36_021687 [Cryptolaemus montrouzieri]|uniref:C2H2-type domain-containing protein n=1 Tax=Cryptolaemus montrouzieri TaxID=559131 RepID=A0ABD2MXN7_9CUCU
MDFSNIETTHTSQFIKQEDNSFVNQFIDVKEKTWERNNFINSYEGSIREGTNMPNKLEFLKIEPGQTEENFSVISETSCEDFDDMEKKISNQEVEIKYEVCEDLKIDTDGYGTVISKIEEDSGTVEHELFDEKNWHEVPSSENSVKFEKVEDKIFDEMEMSEVNDSQVVLKNHKLSHGDYQLGGKRQLKDHVNGTKVSKRKYKCSHCVYEATQKSHLTTHINSVHLRIKNYKCDQCDYQASYKDLLKNI